MNWRAVAVCLLIGTMACLSYLAAHRYQVVIGGSSRYYTAIKIDRITGKSWAMNFDREWVEIPNPAPQTKP